MITSRKSLIIGESLQRFEGEIAELVTSVLNGRISARSGVVERTGDIRFWGVPVTESGIIRRLVDFAEAQFHLVTGRLPGSSFVMVNRIDAKSSPEGSGDGWHRDSLLEQYKAFTYLTDVRNEAHGAFCYLPRSNSPLVKLWFAGYRIATGGSRYTDGTIRGLKRIGVPSESVLLPAGIPFFVDTSLIHRGLPISEGCRIAATVYLFPGEVSADFRRLLDNGSSAAS